MKKPNQQNGFMNHVSSNAQFGGTILGFILGLGAGLGIAFVIAFYLSKNTPQERPGVRAPNLPLNIIKPAPPPAEGETTCPGPSASSPSRPNREKPFPPPPNWPPGKAAP